MRATLRLDLLVALVEMPGTAIYLIEPMRKKRVLWEVRVMKASVASDVLVGTAYEPDEKTARKAAFKELTVRRVDQNRLLIRRAA